MPHHRPRQLPFIRLRRETQDEQAHSAIGFKYAGGDVGDRNQIGGKPSWLQGDQSPTCPQCQGAMSFYGQLDSVGDDIVIADCGLIYVFFCFGCQCAEAVVQSY
jgi:hypothetical protein